MIGQTIFRYKITATLGADGSTLAADRGVG